MLVFVTELEEKQLNYAKYMYSYNMRSLYIYVHVAADKTKRIQENSGITRFNRKVSNSM